MRKLLVFLAACDGSTSLAPDASMPDAGIACVRPTTAPDLIVLTGVTLDLVTLAPLSNTAIEAVGTSTISAVSDASGAYSLTLPTGGVPVAGYLHASHAGYLDTYDYAAGPSAADASSPIPLITAQARDAGAATVGITQTADTGALLVRIADCSGTAIAGAQLGTIGTLRYGNDQGAPSTTATMTGRMGLVYAYNVPPGTVTLTATYDNQSLVPVTVMIAANAATVVGIRP